MRELNEKCAVFGVYGKDLDVSRLTFFGLFALQHRGQESSGIATSDAEDFRLHKKMGLVTHAYEEENIRELVGHIAIGHNRYSTSKNSTLDHAQPIISKNGLVALAHNGNLPSTKALEIFLKDKGIETEGRSDSTLMTEALAYFVEKGLSLEEAVVEAFPLFTGAFSLLVMDKDNLIAVRDEYGIRPLSYATLQNGYVFSSETCAFKPIGAQFVSDVLPGQMMIVNTEGIKKVQLKDPKQKMDIFEFVYFARPDSSLLGRSVYQVRREFGKELAREHKIDADMVIPVPETAIPAAIGYAEESGIPFEMALIKNKYIHRTFIQPEQHLRDQGVKMKLTPLPEILLGKRVVVIDDSIVRGTTSAQIVKSLFDAGAKEVHMLISSAPIRYPDFYGIDLPDQKKLIAFDHSLSEIREYLGATSVQFLTFRGMIKATGIPEDQFNTSCFTGEYPLDILERKELVSTPKQFVEEEKVSLVSEVIHS